MSTRTVPGSPPAPESVTPASVFLLCALLAAVAAYRAWIVQVSGINLFVDEAYYLGWASEPALGYYSKPPLIAWTLAVLSRLCGTGELCVKASAFFWYAVAAVFTCFTAGRLFGRPLIGVLAGIALYTMPAVGLLSLTASTDAPLLAFWALGLWLFTLAIDEQPGAWIGVGIAIGLGLLSKYTMILFPVSMFLYLLLGPDRGWLRLPGPWLALAVAMLVFSPNLWWNFQNGFPSFTHTAELAKWTGDVDHLGEALEFLGGQLGVFGLLSFPLLVVFCLLPAVWRDAGKRMLLLFTLPLLLMYTGQAWIGGAYINWALASYVAATVLLVGQLFDWGRAGVVLLCAVLTLNVASNLLLYHWRDIAPAVGVELGRRTDPWSRILGWREMGAQVKALREPFPEAVLLGDSRTVLAEMSYYAGPWPDVAAWNPDGSLEHHYELTADITDSRAERFLYVGGLPLEALADSFARAQRVGEARFEVYPDRVLEVSVYLLDGFRGYAAGTQEAAP